MNYEDFIAGKRLSAPPVGIAAPGPVSDKLFPFQRDIVRWALRRGKAAIFADTGLGKGWMTLEWCRAVAEHSGLPVLILAPLAVSKQFERESAKLGFGVTACAEQSDVRPGVNVTNYQKLHRFDVSAFGGVALDESSIIKSIDGKTRALLTEAFETMAFKLCATATPSPNDHTELGAHAEFLGVMKQSEMLATFFAHDGGSTKDWRLKGHARSDFWSWVASWGAIVKMPSDVCAHGGGCQCDDGYQLPPLRYHEHVIAAERHDVRSSGLLFAMPAETLAEERAARRGTLESRVKAAADIANATGEQVIVWAGLNDESVALTESIDGAVEVTGSQDDDDKEARIEAFMCGEHRVLVSKSTICGFGLNLQQVTRVIFCGVSHSFEQFYQAVRRCWRFGQSRPVDVHIVTSELEGRIVENLKEKQRKADQLSEETRHHVAAYVRAEVGAMRRDTIEYQGISAVKWPSWLQTEAP